MIVSYGAAVGLRLLAFCTPLRDLDAAVRSQYNLPANLTGALVTAVDESSAAYDDGLRPGAVIREINRKPVGNADDAVTLTQHLKGKRILLLVYSQGGNHYMVVDESKAK